MFLVKLLLVALVAIIDLSLVESLYPLKYANNNNVEDSGNEQNFDSLLSSGSFSIRSQIELYDDGILKRGLRVLEKYSASQTRAVVELEPTDEVGQSGPTLIGAGPARVIHYHDAKSMVWLRWAKNQCLGSSRIELDTEMFGKELSQAIGPPLSGSSRHLVGAARLLVATKEARASFVPSTEPRRMIRGIEALAFDWNRPQDGIKLEVLHHAAAARSNYSGTMDGDGVPMWLKLTTTSTTPNRTLVVNFYQVKKLQSATPNGHQLYNSAEVGSFLFPLGIGCGGVLKEMADNNKNEQLALDRELLKRSMQPIKKLSFQARYLSAVGGIERSVGAGQQMETLLLSFNMGTNLLRRETLLLDQSMGPHKGAKSITIYDFGLKRKYNLVSTFSFKARDYNYPLSNIVDEGSEKTECIAMDMGDDTETLEFINFERLQFMGKAQMDGLETRVYEEDNLERLPFWLDPTRPPLAEVAGSSSGAESNKLPVSQTQNRSSTSRVDYALIYYFSNADSAQQDSNNDGNKRRWLAQLLKIEIIHRDSLRNSVLNTKEVRIFNFIWDQLLDSPSGIRNVDLFALSANCVPNKLWKSSHLSMYLDSTSSQLAENMDPTWVKLARQWNRNEAILRVMSTDLRLPKTHIDHIESSIINQNLTTGIGLEFRANDLSLKQVRLRALGRGQFLSQERLMQSNAFTFEDCFWFANYCYARDRVEIVFAHDDEQSLCLVDKLYKWRDLQYHEAHLSATNKLRSLNYFPYEYGKYVMHTISHAPANNNDQRQNPLDRLMRTLDYIGKRVTLILDHDGDTNGDNNNNQGDNDSQLELNYSIKHMKVESLSNGFTSNNTKQLGNKFKHLGWHQSSGSDQLVKELSSLMLVAHLKNHPRAVGAAAWTEALCRSYCLVDIECKSYSFCERSRYGEAECLLSRLDVRQPALSQQLDSIPRFNSGILGEDKIKKLSVPSMATAATTTTTDPMEVFVHIDKRCSIYGKSYRELFDKSYQIQIDLAQQSEVFSVAKADECAEKCFARNLNYLKAILSHKLDLDQIQRDLTKMIKSNQLVSESSFDRLDEAANWHHGNLQNLCLQFMYAENNSTNNPCILHGLPKTKNYKLGPTDGGSGGSLSAANKRTQMMAINVHKVIFDHLYERMHGFRLSETEQPASGVQGDSIMANYSLRLELHQSGHNKQILLATDDVEHCARVCTLQTHGPRPSCSSFDYVYEKGPNSTGRKYCLLNSQSLHDLRRKGSTDKQVVYTDNLVGVQFWHFEPRNSLLIPLDNQDKNSDDYLLGTIIASLDGSTKKSDECGAFESILLAITLFAIVSGSFLGIKLVNYWKSNIDEITFKNRVIRTVHRLSGVSLRQGVQDREVQM